MWLIIVYLDYVRIIGPYVYIAMAATRKLQGKEMQLLNVTWF